MAPNTLADGWAVCKIDNCGRPSRHSQAHQCNRHYRQMQKARAGICKIHKCQDPAVRVGHGLCEKHYYRNRRNGTFDGPVIAGRYEVKSGYVLLLMPDHPLAEKSRRSIYEHRFVAYETRQGVCTPCHWCGVQLTWDSATVDHLNEVKDDNRPENLVVACNSCNRARGQLKPFIKSMTDLGFEEFIAHARAYRSNR